MLEFIDPQHFSDYVIVNWYAGNRDWPENNWYADVENPAGRNRFFVWDAETTWDDGAAIVLGSDGVEGAPYPNVVKLVFEALMQNADFRLTFADRLYKHLNHDGALTDANAQARWTCARRCRGTRHRRRIRSLGRRALRRGRSQWTTGAEPATKYSRRWTAMRTSCLRLPAKPATIHPLTRLFSANRAANSTNLSCSK